MLPEQLSSQRLESSKFRRPKNLGGRGQGIHAGVDVVGLLPYGEQKKTTTKTWDGTATSQAHHHFPVSLGTFSLVREDKIIERQKKVSSCFKHQESSRHLKTIRYPSLLTLFNNSTFQDISRPHASLNIPLPVWKISASFLAHASRCAEALKRSESNRGELSSPLMENG